MSEQSAELVPEDAKLVTLARATRLVAETTSLSDEAADSVARRVLAPTRDGAGLSPSLFAQRLRRGRGAGSGPGAPKRESSFFK